MRKKLIGIGALVGLAGSLAGGLLVAGGASAAPPAQLTNSDEFKLENGLQVILMPLPSASKNALVVVFDVGNQHDPPGQSGLAHLAEHLYVTAATRATPARTVDQYLTRYPDGWNAQTGDDYTVIAAVFTPERTAEELAEAAHRMSGLQVTPQDLQRELPRLEVELDNMYQRIPALAVHNHGRQQRKPLASGGRRGGRIGQLQGIQTHEVQQWLDRHCKPGNATLVVAGRFDEEAVRQQIRERFSGIEPGEPPDRATPPEWSGPGVHEVAVRPHTADPAVRVGFTFAAPDPNDPLYAAFAVQATRLIMAGQRLAQQHPGEFPYLWRPLDDPDFFSASTTVHKGETREQAVARLEKSLDDLLLDELRPADLLQARNLLGMFYGIADVPPATAGANPYGTAFAAGRRHRMRVDSRELKQRLEGLDSQSLRAARRFFSPENRSVVIVRPVDD